MFRFRTLLEAHLEELTLSVSMELGKNIEGPRGHHQGHGGGGDGLRGADREVTIRVVLVKSTGLVNKAGIRIDACLVF
jgi:hypothetical protein